MKNNGGIIGKNNTPTIDAASGVWGLREQLRSVRNGVWPLMIPTEGLALFLDAGNADSYSGSGTAWNDVSGNSRDCSWVSTPSYGTDSGVPCFTTLGNRCVGPASNSFGIDNTSGYTLFIVMKQITLVNTAAFKFYKDGSGDATRGIFSHLTFGNNTIYFDQGGCCSTDTRTSVASGGSQTWNVWTLRRETASSNRSILKNGVSLVTNTVTAADINLNSVPADIVGCDEYGGDSSTWDAKIASFIVYNRGLTDVEVLNTANLIKTRYGI